ncbi:MAG TPA: glycosyltransferase, partial [Acidiferrobacterales bacterium]|nr:glycosyltransferase [Acidiferrobacterales bacterium]
AVLGNLKFDIEAPPAQLAAGRALRARIGARSVLLAASTREGEEAQILEAFAAEPRGDLLLVIVPRHPQRFDAVAQMIGKQRLKYQRRSEDCTVAADAVVLLGDSMGEMFAYYAACDVAFIGGSLLALGGQNLIEACAVGAPVLVGPHTFNFAQATDQAIAAGAARRIGDAGELLQEAEKLLGDAAARRAMGQAGRDFAARHRGATEKTLALIARYLQD